MFLLRCPTITIAIFVRSLPILKIQPVLLACNMSWVPAEYVMLAWATRRSNGLVITHNTVSVPIEAFFLRPPPTPNPTFLVVMAQLLYLTHVIAEVYASHTRKIFAPPTVVACKHRDSLVQ